MSDLDANQLLHARKRFREIEDERKEGAWRPIGSDEQATYDVYDICAFLFAVIDYLLTGEE